MRLPEGLNFQTSLKAKTAGDGQLSPSVPNWAQQIHSSAVNCVKRANNEQAYGKKTFRAKQAPRRRSQRTAASPQAKTGTNPAKAPRQGRVWAAPRAPLARLFAALSHALGLNLAAWAGGLFVARPWRGLFRVNPAGGQRDD